MSLEATPAAKGQITRTEIHNQPELWKDTLRRVRDSPSAKRFQQRAGGTVIAGAGTSAYIALAIESSMANSRAIPTTDLLIDMDALPARTGFLLSIARSGDSPESCAVVRRLQRKLPEIGHFAITCNAQGALANLQKVESLILDPRTNDRSLVMTSSFSNLALAGAALQHEATLEAAVPEISERTAAQLPSFEVTARALAARKIRRFVALASRALFASAMEASLKVLEMTAGRVAAISETFLGLRHGPMSFLDSETLVLAFLSSDPWRRRYETDLLAELRAKKLGFVVAITPCGIDPALVDVEVAANAPNLADSLRTPFEIVFAQVLGMHLSLREGLDPDKPSPDGVISRVVQGVTIYEG